MEMIVCPFLSNSLCQIKWGQGRPRRGQEAPPPPDGQNSMFWPFFEENGIFCGVFRLKVCSDNHFEQKAKSKCSLVSLNISRYTQFQAWNYFTNKKLFSYVQFMQTITVYWMYLLSVVDFDGNPAIWQHSIRNASLCLASEFGLRMPLKCLFN